MYFIRSVLPLSLENRRRFRAERRGHSKRIHGSVGDLEFTAAAALSRGRFSLIYVFLKTRPSRPPRDSIFDGFHPRRPPSNGIITFSVRLHSSLRYSNRKHPRMCVQTCASYVQTRSRRACATRSRTRLR